MTGLVFKPEEIQQQLKASHKDSISMHYDSNAISAVNEQINVEYNISYAYHAMACYFDRSEHNLPGFARYFREKSLEERLHAQLLMDFQSTRGGKVQLLPLQSPESEFADPAGKKSDALYSMELALSLERLNYEKLLGLWRVFDDHSDPQSLHFVENMLDEQVDDVKRVADFVGQLHRIGSNGYGIWQFDHELYEEEVRYRVVGSDGDRISQH